MRARAAAVALALLCAAVAQECPSGGGCSAGAGEEEVAMLQTKTNPASLATTALHREWCLDYDCCAGREYWQYAWSQTKKAVCCVCVCERQKFGDGISCGDIWSLDVKESLTVSYGDDNSGSNSFLQKSDRSPKELPSGADCGLRSVPGVPQQAVNETNSTETGPYGLVQRG